jgi:hypothetical protein
VYDSKRSILRLSAQSYARRRVSRNEYRQFRRELLRSILGESPLPPLPEHWLDASTDPSPTDSTQSSSPNRRALSLALTLVFALVAVVAVLAYSSHLRASLWRGLPGATVQRPAEPVAEFRQIAQGMLAAKVWDEDDISTALRCWDKLSLTEKSAARSQTWHGQLVLTARQYAAGLRGRIAATADPSAHDRLATAVDMMVGALGSR